MVLLTAIHFISSPKNRRKETKNIRNDKKPITMLLFLPPKIDLCVTINDYLPRDSVTNDILSDI